MERNSWMNTAGLMLLAASCSTEAKVLCWQSHLTAQLQNYEIYRTEQADQDGFCYPGEQMYLIHSGNPSLRLPMQGHTVTAIQEFYLADKQLLQITLVTGANTTTAHFFEISDKSLTPAAGGVISVSKGIIWTSRGDQGSLITETQSTTLLDSCQILVHEKYTYANDSFVLTKQWEDKAENCSSGLSYQN